MRPDLIALHAAARRERAAELHRLIVAPVVRFFRRKPEPQLRVAACH
jgi:hypothetical protein